MGEVTLYNFFWRVTLPAISRLIWEVYLCGIDSVQLWEIKITQLDKKEKFFFHYDCSFIARSILPYNSVYHIVISNDFRSCVLCANFLASLQVIHFVSSILPRFHSSFISIVQVLSCSYFCDFCFQKFHWSKTYTLNLFHIL